MAQGVLFGGDDAHGAAVDGSQRGDNVLAVACVQGDSAALVSQSLDGIGGGVGGGVQRSGGGGEVEQRGTCQIVGGQQRGNLSSLLGSLNSVSGGGGSHACLGGKGGGAGPCQLILGIEGRVEEQLGVLCHNAQVSGGGVDGVGAGAGAGDNGDLGYNTGHAGDLGGQAGVGVEQLKTALQLGADRVVEGHDRRTGLCCHFQHADIFFDVLYAHSAAILKNGVGALTVGAAESCTYGTVRKQRRVDTAVKKCCKDLCLAGLICCHTVSSLW